MLADNDKQISVHRDMKEVLALEARLEFSVDDVKVSDGLNYLYCVQVNADAKLLDEFLFGEPSDSGSGGHYYKDRFLIWPKDFDKG